MLLITDYDNVTGINRIIIISFTLAMIAGAFLIAVLMLIKHQKTEIKTQRTFLKGISSFAILLGLGRFVLLYHDYFAPNELDDPLWRAGSVISLLGLTVLALAIELTIFPKTKKAISIFGFICGILVLFTPKFIATPALYAGNIVVTILPFFIYIYIAKISTGSLRKQALIIILGMIVSFIGQLGGAVLFNLQLLDRLWSQLFGIILSFIGLVLLTYGFAKSPSS